MKYSLIYRCILVVFYYVIAGSCVHAQEQAINFPQSQLAIQTQQNNVPFDIELATTVPQQEYGLMFRTQLADKHGMLFIFPESRQVAFWMKNTLIPLAMIFINQDGIITQIVENAKPESTQTIPSDAVVRAVLEVPGNTAKRYHIAKGDKVAYSIFP